MYRMYSCCTLHLFRKDVQIVQLIVYCPGFCDDEVEVLPGWGHWDYWSYRCTEYRWYCCTVYGSDVQTTDGTTVQFTFMVLLYCVKFTSMVLRYCVQFTSMVQLHCVQFTSMVQLHRVQFTFLVLLYSVQFTSMVLLYCVQFTSMVLLYCVQLPLWYCCTVYSLPHRALGLVFIHPVNLLCVHFLKTVENICTLYVCIEYRDGFRISCRQGSGWGLFSKVQYFAKQYFINQDLSVSLRNKTNIWKNINWPLYPTCTVCRFQYNILLASSTSHRPMVLDYSRRRRSYRWMT